MSIDGFMTKGSDGVVTPWTSAEEKAHFAQLRSEHKLFVFGRNTYEASLPATTPGVLKIVLTHHPEEYKDQEIQGSLEFHNLSAQQFVNKYQKKFDSCLILGGSVVNTEFLEAGLVDEIYLTVEPVHHGSGVPLLKNVTLEKFVLKPSSISMLNTSGTVLKHYILKK